MDINLALYNLIPSAHGTKQLSSQIDLWTKLEKTAIPVLFETVDNRKLLMQVVTSHDGFEHMTFRTEVKRESQYNMGDQPPYNTIYGYALKPGT